MSSFARRALRLRAAREHRSRRLFLESLERRDMLTFPPLLISSIFTGAGAEFPANNPVDPECSCICESGPVSGGGNRTSLWAGPGLNRLVNYSLDYRNPVFTVPFNLPASWADATSLEAFVSMGGLTTSSLWFDPSLIEGGTDYVFSVPFDVSSLSSGRYEWTMTLRAMIGEDEHTKDNTEVFFVDPPITGPFGHSWTYDGLDVATVTTDGVSIVQANGNRHWFTKLGSSNNYQAESGNPLAQTLVKNGDNTFTLTDRHGNVTNFSAIGLLTSRVDTNGLTTAYAYTDGDGDSQTDDISTITDPVGRVTSFSYTSGRVSSITDFAGRATSLGYNTPAAASIASPSPIRIRAGRSRPHSPPSPTTPRASSPPPPTQRARSSPSPTARWARSPPAPTKGTPTNTPPSGPPASSPPARAPRPIPPPSSPPPRSSAPLKTPPLAPPSSRPTRTAW
jgi:hypothetical protein